MRQDHPQQPRSAMEPPKQTGPKHTAMALKGNGKTTHKNKWHCQTEGGTHHRGGKMTQAKQKNKNKTKRASGTATSKNIEAPIPEPKRDKGRPAGTDRTTRRGRGRPQRDDTGARQGPGGAGRPRGRRRITGGNTPRTPGATRDDDENGAKRTEGGTKRREARQRQALNKQKKGTRQEAERAA